MACLATTLAAVEATVLTVTSKDAPETACGIVLLAINDEAMGAVRNAALFVTRDDALTLGTFCPSAFATIAAATTRVRKLLGNFDNMATCNSDC